MRPNFKGIPCCTLRYDRRIHLHIDQQQTFPGVCVEAAVIVNTCGREWSFPLTVALRSSVNRPERVADGGLAPNGSERQSSQVQPRAGIGKPFIADRPNVQEIANPLNFTVHTMHVLELQVIRSCIMQCDSQ